MSSFVLNLHKFKCSSLFSNAPTKPIGNIPYTVTENELGNFFSQAGNVTNVRIVYDRETNRPKGFGFCEFADQQGAENAVTTLNGADFSGRALRVNWASK